MDTKWEAAEFSLTSVIAFCVAYQMVENINVLNYIFILLSCFSAVSDTTGEILLVKKKAVQGLIKDHASKATGGIGCKIKDGEVVLDRKTFCEAQTALHVCNLGKAVCLFVNSNNLHDFFTKEVVKDDSYFSEKVENKIVKFFDQFLSLKVVEDDTFIKC